MILQYFILLLQYKELYDTWYKYTAPLLYVFMKYSEYVVGMHHILVYHTPVSVMV